MQIQLTWDDPITEEQQQHRFEVPIAIGRELAQLPTIDHGQPVSQLVLLDANQKISRFHAWITNEQNQIIVEDRSANGCGLNGQSFKHQQRSLQSGDVLRVGTYDIAIKILQPASQSTIVEPRYSTIVTPPTEIKAANQVSAPPPSTIIFHPETDAIETQVRPPAKRSCLIHGSIPNVQI